MSVRSHEVEEERERGTALVSRSALARQQNGFERFVAVLLLLVSLAGSVLAGGGGIERWLKLTPVLWGAGAALALQGLLSYVQWIYAARGFHAWQYWLAVGGSSALTIGGYWPLVHSWLVGRLEAAQVPTYTAPYIAGLLLGIAALGTDIFPEKTLTKE